MPNFKISNWRRKQIKKNFKRKDMVQNRAVTEIEKIMFTAIDHVIDHGMMDGNFRPPSLNDIYKVTDDFYYSILKETFLSCQEEKKEQLKRLSAWPIGIPRSLKGLEKIFRDKRYWPTIMKRSKKITDIIRKAYLGKLKKKFDVIIPLLRNGELMPQEAKKQLKEAWKSSKSRVEMIFRTETTTYFEKTQTAFFKSDPEILGFMFDSITDSARSDICRSRHGMIYRPDHIGIDSISYNTPSLHYNCRSHMIALANTEENRKLLEESNRDPAKNRSKIVPLPKGWR